MSNRKCPECGSDDWEYQCLRCRKVKELQEREQRLIDVLKMQREALVKFGDELAKNNKDNFIKVLLEELYFVCGRLEWIESALKILKEKKDT